jgi:SAM-dependent methyltransferase
MSDVRPEIIEHYEADLEQFRLLQPKGQIERIRTQRLLQRVLPTRGRVLDVGGGTGIYARWLLDLGYDVEVIDPAPVHVAHCTRAGIHAEIGDARHLQRDDGEYDAVLLLGPLYHLPERDDRVLALREAHRVLRPGGVVGAAAISRYAGWLDLMQRRIDALLEHRALVEQELLDGRHETPEGTDLFTTAYFHHPDELGPELAEAGFDDVDVRAVEGPALLMESINTVEPEVMCDLIEPLDQIPSLLGATAHLLATGRRAD